MKSLLKSKKGQLGNLEAIITTLVVVGILLGIAFYVMDKFFSQFTATSQAAIAVNDTIIAMATIPSWLTIIVIVAIAGIILAIVFAVLPRAGSSM